MTLRRLKRSYWRTAIAAVTALAVSLSCNHEVPSRPSNEDVIRLFGMCPPNEPTPGPVPHVDFWLDDSLSMAGYVSGPSAYRQVVRRIILGSVQAGYQSSIHGFSSGAIVPLESIGAVLGPAYYRATDTRLAAILDEVSKPKENGEPDKIVVLVSDLIQDEQSKDSLAIASSLRRVATRFPNVVLYGFRSAFNGTFFITSPPRGKVPIYTLDGIGRPFYVLVLSPSPEALRQFQRFAGLHELLAEKTFAGKSFEPSFAPIAVDSVRLRNDPDPEKNEWTGFDTPSEWPSSDGRKSQIISFQSTPTVRDGDVRLSFALRANTLLPLVVPSRYQAEVRRLTPDQKKVQAAPEVTMTAAGDLAQASATLSYRFPKPAYGRWEVYSIRVRAGDANLMRPNWITDWSTDDDSLADTRDRTLNLSAFGDALVRAIAERTVFLDQVIELYRGD